MQYRKMGSLDFKVSALGLGCMRLPTLKFMPLKVNQQKAVKLIRSAIDKGINYLDSGWLYHFGDSERILGIALQDGYREKVHLATKLPMFMVKKEEDFDKFLNSQLVKMQTGYLDTYLFHSMDKNGLETVKKFNLIEKMSDAKKQGKIRHIGFSFHDTFPVFKEIVDYYDWDIVQIQYNYMDTGIQATTAGLKYAAAKGMAVVIMEPLKGGKLANPPAEVVAIMKTAKIKRTPVDWALQYLWNLPEVSVVLSGMSSQKMLNENYESAARSGIGSLSKEELSIIDQLTEIYNRNILVPCTACQYCLPCPAGVNIPHNFALLNNIGTGTPWFFKMIFKRGYRRLADSPRKLNSEKTNGNAALCINCGQCLEKCPQKIQIPDELKNVHAILKGKKKISEVYKKEV